MNGTSLLLFICLVTSLASLAVSFFATPVVRTPSGPVRGLVLRTVWHSIEYSSFKGIPYAEPPLGDLRFKPPVPKKPWRNVLYAFKEGSMCPQLNLMTSELGGHENCLYLNVFTREVEFKDKLKLRPVMVWMYGGAYFTGYSNTSVYGPDFFMEEDIVLVSFNYRLGVLGFLALDHPDAMGNAGLKDQNLVLHWVQRNIAAFAGDPKRVTIFGESAGATSVGFHTLSERSRGLFLRSISMSGTPLCLWAYHTPEKMIQNAYKLANLLNFVPKSKDDLLNYFRQAPASSLVIAAQNVDLNFLPFRPTRENPEIDYTNSTFLTECPITKYNNGDFHHHDVMLGYTRDEVLLFLGPPIGVANMIDWALKYVKHASKLKEITKEPIDLFARTISDLYKTSYRKLETLMVDIFFAGPIDLTQRLLAEYNKGHPIYYYRLSYQTKYSWHKVEHNPLNGTAHFDDVGYIFNSKELHAPTSPRNRFNRFRKRMVNMWANFAKYGNPTPKDKNRMVNWIDSSKDGLQLDINTVPRMHERFTDKKEEEFQRLYYRILPLVSSCVEQPTKFFDFV
ncbi:hypothetical protein E2986_07677 [Frieseomelitta varia]|uniref:Carboxylesterase type B domain-containing protein n=1 Tax=Frieseomelitta varia TaxID=561572 RepID=A0A833SPH3_9HYME|nr:juvenile hormone esterase-like [Frieseomelitta varia]KAF3430578.1 hypothetical protein E2986_07677 [Frieseomelitta varia]